jgi:phosphoserine phosphatase
MSGFVVNVIGQDADPALFQALGPVRELSPGFAFDIASDDDAALDAARAIAGERPWDINRIATANRRKTLLVADMDSTIINVECLDELADMAGLKPRIAAITERAMRGELVFEAALKERVGMLKGLPLAALEKTYAERVRLNPGAKSLLATMRAHGGHGVLGSGGFGFFTSRVAALACFHEHYGNSLIDDGAALTGEVGMPILGKEAKVETMQRTVARLGIANADVLAVGDGANDLGMITLAGMGVAYHAKPVVAAAAGAAIQHNTLEALLYLQGYGDGEITRE